MTADADARQRLKSLEDHLRVENPLLTDVVSSFRQIDHVTRRLGFFDRDESHTSRISWWPLISVLGIYSSGKSAFINHFLRYPLQITGNQAVDDKFSVICFGSDSQVRTLPGLALDADPRFPLFKISRALEEVGRGQSEHIDRYLQLKTCPSEKLRGRILIDSPGFDADEQRSSTLRITNHIIDLSDLVLVFFDARHPESGSMPDTLEHLVQATMSRRDAGKFLYILNQIDSTAREDNTEEVFAAWKRALAQKGLTTGCCFAVYNPDLALPIENDRIRIRLENRRDADLKSIFDRIDQVGVERAYRIVGMLKKTVQEIEQEIVPTLESFVDRWRRTVFKLDGVVFGILLVLFLLITMWAEMWDGLRLVLPFGDQLFRNGWLAAGFVMLLAVAAGYVHFRVRRRAAMRVGAAMLARLSDPNLQQHYRQAFHRNCRWWRSVLLRRPAGWDRRSGSSLSRVLDDANTYIRKLNDTFTNPSGHAPVPECNAPRSQTLQTTDNASAEAPPAPSGEQPLKVIGSD